MNVQFRWGFRQFTLQSSFKPLLLKEEGGGGLVQSVVEVTVNGKEENSQDFGPNYVHEFGFSLI